MKITFGALAPDLSEQLAGCGLPSDALRHFDLDAEAIVRLSIRGYLSDSATLKARQRLMREIERMAKQVKR